MNQSATIAIEAPATPSTSKLAFARHYAEMVLVMFAGMLVLGGIAELVFAVAGSSLDVLSGGLMVAWMGLSMTVPMVAWMAYRGHTWAQNVEMAGSMIIPTILGAVLTWSGAIDTAMGLAIQHVVMLPAMLAVMLWRYDEYAHVLPRLDREAGSNPASGVLLGAGSRLCPAAELVGALNLRGRPRAARPAATSFDDRLRAPGHDLEP